MWLIIGVVVASVCGSLWAIGGDSRWSINWRRLGVPAVVSLLALGIGLVYGSSLWWIAFIQFGVFVVATTIGYGIPDDPANPHGDDGSPLGAFFYRIVSGSTHSEKAEQANFYTRLVCGLAYGGAIAIGCLIKMHIWAGVLGVLCVVVSTVYINALSQDPGPIGTLNGREFMTGLGIGIGACVVML